LSCNLLLGAIELEISRPSTALTIECWTLPESESELQRMDRVMTTFLEALEKHGVVMPSNIRRLEACGERHPGCFVYEFGTRRVHIATRDGEGGRITLVVRVGGGFLDFVQFVQRFGSLESVKLERHSEDGMLRLSSVLSQGHRHVRELPS